MQATPEGQRDHLFISYATEDIGVAEWLTFKLTGLGYRVWCDGIKLFGGESYPKDIDDAIKNRTHRFLAVMSEYSVNKPNPRKERTIAHSISKERQINFTIPLNLGLKPTQLDWMTSDLTYVDFSVNWAEGLATLLKALRKAQTPCLLENGKDVVSDSLVSGEIIKAEPETIHSNFLTIKKIPEAISVIRLEGTLSYQKRRELQDIWASRYIRGITFLSFHKPPEGYRYQVENAYLWKNADDIEGINKLDIVSELLRKNLNCHCLTKGLLWSQDHRWLYFPFGITENNRLSFVDTHGKKNWIQACGERTFFRPGKSSRYRYHLSPTFRIMRDVFGQQFIIKVGLRIRITSTAGRPIVWSSAQARRKHVSQDWWNYEWVSRYLAICSFLSDGGDEIVIGENEPYTLVFSAKPLSYLCPISLDEVRIHERQRDRKKIVV